jgi:hypothetical protein
MRMRARGCRCTSTLERAGTLPKSESVDDVRLPVLPTLPVLHRVVSVGIFLHRGPIDTQVAGSTRALVSHGPKLEAGGV